MIDELTRTFQQDAQKAEERVEILEQTCKMLMRRLEAVMGQARRALVGEPMP